MFCSPVLVLGSTRAPSPVFMFYATGLAFGGIKDVMSCIQDSRSQTYFWRKRERRFQFSCFTLQDSFWVVLRTSGPILTFCAIELIFDRTEGTGSSFHVLHSRTRFVRFRGRRVQFSCFTLPNTFWVVPRALCRVFMFCAPGLIFGGTSGPVFMFCALGLISGGTEGARSNFHILRFRTHFR
jgi:hypothetical protein